MPVIERRETPHAMAVSCFSNFNFKIPQIATTTTQNYTESIVEFYEKQLIVTDIVRARFLDHIQSLN